MKLISVQKLTDWCRVCGTRADYLLTLDCYDPSKPRSFGNCGTMSKAYCDDHVPAEAKELLEDAFQHAQTPFQR